MHARTYEAQHSQIANLKKLPISSGGHFTKLNARQSFPLYGQCIFSGWLGGP